ncbi:DUF6541 family protein [Georgenia thermotolerans]|uniref:Uncharacterized protein n=1 Tax=Georgenia thermotolerans TaxID=527326 RepID=A0A7J5UQ76_9MICO|nr:DUF6541 family protein [Georgenia thermotolerans]KAE8764566.1 hypothetical protein GB883_08470 [Georgenia thermotolerans]
MAWWGMAAAAAAMAVLAFAPGWLCLRLLRVRGLVALAAAPSVTMAVFAVAAVLYDDVGVRWTLPTALLAALAAALATAVLGWLVKDRSSLNGSRVRLEAPHLSTGELRPDAGPGESPRPGASVLTPGAAGPLPPARAAALPAARAGAVVAAVGLAILPLALGMRHLSAPLQSWDGIFHVNALALVRETGNASSLGGLAPMYPLHDANYYPAAWHALVSVAPGLSSVVVAANLSTLVLVVPWILGITALATVALPHRPRVSVLAPLFAATYIAFPVVTVTVQGQWPYGASVALLPGAAALVLAALRPGGARSLSLILAAAAATAGVALAHATSVFSLVVLVGPWIVFGAVQHERRRWRAGRRREVVRDGVLAAMGLAIVVVVLSQSSLFGSVVGFNRRYFGSHAAVFFNALRDKAAFGRYPASWVGNLPVAGFVIAGTVLTFRRREGRWLAGAWASFLLLWVIAGGSPPFLRWLAGPWWTEPSRLAALAIIPASLLAGLGADAALRAGAERAARLPASTSAARRAVPVGVVVLAIVASLAMGTRLGTKERIVASAYVPGRITYGTVLDADDAAVLARMPQTLPPDAVVLGDPAGGAAYAYAIGHRHVVFPQLTVAAIRSPDPREPHVFLAMHFNQLHQDARVCDAVRAVGATYFYQDTAGDAQGDKVSDTTLGLRNVDTSRGFELVDRSGTVSLYRITACG